MDFCSNNMHTLRTQNDSAVNLDLVCKYISGLYLRRYKMHRRPYLASFSLREDLLPAITLPLWRINLPLTSQSTTNRVAALRVNSSGNDKPNIVPRYSVTARAESSRRFPKQHERGSNSLFDCLHSLDAAVTLSAGSEFNVRPQLE